VFGPDTKDVFDQAVKSTAERGIFADSTIGSCQYEQCVATLTP
jgi:hypothetical protein